MIAKNIKGKSFKGCVRYVMNETAKLLEAEGVLARNKEKIIRGFAMQRSGRREIKQPVGHIPISFAPEDKERMTDDFMVQLAKEYMEEMGIRNTQYIIVRHHNTNNDHLHIVYNRIDNNLKLISVNYDYKRNIKVCKKLKDRHKLTYGEGKERVKREKLRNPNKAKYYIHDAIKSVLPKCTIPAHLRWELQELGIELDYKFKRGTSQIEGVSFRYGNISFKGSQVDRKFSFGNLKKAFEQNLAELKRQSQLEREREEKQAGLKAQEQKKQRKQLEEDSSPKSPEKERYIIKGVVLNDEQEETITKGGHIYLKDMTREDGKTKFSGYVFFNDENTHVYMTNENPDTFVKYGKYEMRLRDKVLIECGQITKATVKWWGGRGNEHPYLWKANKSDTDYQESWSDPRLPKQKQKPEETKLKTPKMQEKKRGRGI